MAQRHLRFTLIFLKRGKSYQSLAYRTHELPHRFLEPVLQTGTREI